MWTDECCRNCPKVFVIRGGFVWTELLQVAHTEIEKWLFEAFTRSLSCWILESSFGINLWKVLNYYHKCSLKFSSAVRVSGTSEAKSMADCYPINGEMSMLLRSRKLEELDVEPRDM